MSELRIAAEGRFDYLVIESTGIAEPLPVAATFAFRDEDGESLSDVARLDTMVTVVNAVNLLAQYSSQDFLRDTAESLGDADKRTIVSLLVEQIEFADVLVLNKVGDAGPALVETARKIIRSLNADAALIEADFADVPLSAVLDTGRFDFDRANEHPLWAKELYGFATHVPETEEYGISSFVYRARRPFHPARLQALLTGPLPGVIRAKGHFWIATRPDWVGEFSLAGAVAQTSGLGRWWSAVPKERWPHDPDMLTRVKAQWHTTFGDRRQELVFIGAGLDEAAITAALDACLVPGRPSSRGRGRGCPIPSRAGVRRREVRQPRPDRLPPPPPRALSDGRLRPAPGRPPSVARRGGAALEPTLGVARVRESAGTPPERQGGGDQGARSSSGATARLHETWGAYGDLVVTALPRLATAMNRSGDPDVLRTIGMPGVAVAVWTPEQPDGFQTWIEDLPAGQLPRLRATLPPQHASDAVAVACDKAGTPAGAYRDHLVNRTAELATLASEILASLLVELRLDVTSGQACPKWHLDSVHARLLCTLRGSGTEFGPARPDGTPSAVHRLPAGAAALFRGLLWPGRDLPGIVHRSPPTRPGAIRLLLVVDPVDTHAC